MGSYQGEDLWLAGPVPGVFGVSALRLNSAGCFRRSVCEENRKMPGGWRKGTSGEPGEPQAARAWRRAEGIEAQARALRHNIEWGGDPA